MQFYAATALTYIWIRLTLLCWFRFWMLLHASKLICSAFWGAPNDFKAENVHSIVIVLDQNPTWHQMISPYQVCMCILLSTGFYLSRFDRRYKFRIRHDFRCPPFSFTLPAYSLQLWSNMIAEPDPFAEFLRPPLNETPSERATRRIREAEEKRISDAIDEQIRQERQILQKQKELVKVLLLGQSESGEWQMVPLRI